MRPAPKRPDEAKCLEALHVLQVLDSAADPKFDALVRAAALACETPVALVCLVDSERLWVKANLGLPAVSQAPRDLSFCSHAVLSRDLLEVADASSDPRFANHPWVSGPTQLRFYAGAPLRLSNGLTVGTLCVLDHQAHQLRPSQRQSLLELATVAAKALEGRYAVLQSQHAVALASRVDLMLEHSSDAVIGLSAGGLIERWNPAAVALFGYAQAEIIGQPVSVLRPKGHEQAEDEDFATWVHHSSRSYEAVRCTRQGHPVEVSVTLVPELDSTGQVLGATKFVRDIGPRKQQERALQRSKEFLARAGSMAGVGGWELDLRTMKLYWSEEMCRIHGLDLSTCPTYGEALALCAPDSRPRVAAAVAQAGLDGSPFDLELQIVRADGVLRWVHAIGTVDCVGTQPVRLVGAFRDISDAVANRQELQHTQQRVALATAAGGIGIWEWDLTSNALTWDALMYQLHGVPAGQAVPSFELWRSCVHPLDAAAVSAWLKAATDDDAPTVHEFRVIWPDTTVHFLRLSTQLWRDADGKPVRMVGVSQDISVVTRTEAELRRSNAELEQFAHIASHDLQEPLRMVANFTELLAQRYKGQLDERADKYIHYAVDGAHRMQGLVNDLLAFSRVGAQGKPLQAISTQTVVTGVLQSMQHAIDEAAAVIECQNLPPVMGDAVQLNQLFQNLIGNALKFRSPGTVRIVVTALREADMWLFSVRDNGIGMDMRYAERVFQMFQRLHERGKYDGSGIGLAIAKRIVERHEGAIRFESAAGAGTTFFFTLKAVPADMPPR